MTNLTGLAKLLVDGQGQAYGIPVPLTLNTIMVQIDFEKRRDICPQKVE